MYFYLEHPAAQGEIRYAIAMGGAAGLRLVANTLEFLDKGGAPRLRVAPPFSVDARGTRREARIGIEGCAFDTSPRAPWGRPVTSPGAESCSVTIHFQARGALYPLLVDPQWISTNDMTTPRTRHTATLLDPADAASPVLFAGGFDPGGNALASAELYEPLSRTFAATSPMAGPRGAHTATRLASANAAPVLVAGGSTQASGGSEIATMALYDAAMGTFTSDLSMPTGRFNHTATLIEDGKALLAGGNAVLGQPTNTAYVYTLSPKSISPTSALGTSRAGHAAVLLKSGNILVTGGFVLGGAALQSGEIYSPAMNTWSPVQKLGIASQNMTILRAFHSATLLDSGAVLLVGGTNNTNGGIYTTTADLYVDNGVKRGFVQTGSLGAGRANHTATALTTKEVLVAGGFNGSMVLAAPELYQPLSGTFKPLAAANAMDPRRDHTATLVNAGDSVLAGRGVLVAGGSGDGVAALKGAQVLLKQNGDACTQGDECLSGPSRVPYVMGCRKFGQVF